MGDETQFHGGKRYVNEGLEFIGAPKKSKFRHRTAEAEEKRVHVPQHESDFDQNDSFFPEADLMPELEASIQEEALATSVDSSVSDIPKSSLQRPTLKKDKAVTRKKFKFIFSTFVTVLAIIILIASSFYIKSNQPIVTKNTHKKMGIPLYYMVKNTNFSLDAGSVTVNESNSFVFIVHEKKTSQKFIISQQRIPEIVKDEAQYQQFLVDSDKYASFDSTIGKAYFTKPISIEYDVSIVVKTTATLLFIRGPGDASEDTWTQLVSYLKVAK